MVPAIQVADMWSTKGVLPVAGGSLDQSAGFISFIQQLEAEDRNAKNYNDDLG